MRKLLFVVPAIVALAAATAAANPDARVVYGLSERAGIMELGVDMPAKLDTGAVSASLSAYDTEFFDRDGEEWVRFRLGVEEELDLPLELPVDSWVRIRRRAEDRDEDDKGYSRRPIVKLTLCIGHRMDEVRVNLTDRRDFSYPLLVGADALRTMNVLLDPREDKVAGEPVCMKDAEDPPVVEDEEAEEGDNAGDEQDEDSGRDQGDKGEDGGDGQT